MMNCHKQAALWATTFCLGAALSVQADVKLPAIFGDHMVLQEGMKLPVWGTADPGEAVTVTVGPESSKATTGADGKWKVELPPLDKGTGPVTVTVKGKNSITLSDVLIGDVWICSGQSNMEFNLGGGTYGFGGAHNADTVLPQANDPQMRLFVVLRKTALDPEPDVVGKWELCTTASAGKFSGVGYFFGRELRATLKKPIGLIGTYWGGTPAQAWTSISGLQGDPALKEYVDAYDKIRANLAQATALYPAKLAAFQTSLADWKKNVGPAYAAQLKAWGDSVKQALAAGQAPPPKPAPSSPIPRAPVTADGGSNAPANLYNGMIAPLIPFAFKGAIWYQGEGNAGEPVLYKNLFSDMITDWRQKWNEGDFPFLFVQLACYQSSPVQNWPFLRESQLKTLSLPKTGMAVAVDIGNPTDIHPKDKLDVGIRLALAARHIAYGEKLVYSGPIYDSMKTQGSAISLTFTHEGGGLVIGSAPWLPDGMKPLPTTSLVGFTIAGSDYKWVPADAKIQDDLVVVSSPAVPNPVAVRYDWANYPKGNLYNKEGLPASPFRTDDQPYDPKTALLVPTK